MMVTNSLRRNPIGTWKLCGRVLALSLAVPLCVALTGCTGNQSPKPVVENADDNKAKKSGKADKPDKEKNGNTPRGGSAPPGGTWQIKETLILDKPTAAERFIPSTLCVSPDGGRYAFVRKDGKSRRWVVDGKDDPLSFGQDDFTGDHQLQFSANGKHHAYVCEHREGSGTTAAYPELVINGKVIRGLENPGFGRLHYRGITGDGKLFGFEASFRTFKLDGGLQVASGAVVHITETAIRWASVSAAEDAVTVDDKTTTKGRIADFQFSRNGKSYAFLLDNTRAVVNGKPHAKQFERVVSKLFLSADGDHVLYAGAEGKQFYVCYDSRWHELDGEPTALVLSPDGKHWACRVGNAIVLDGKKAKEHPTAQWRMTWMDKQVESPILFSPDSEHLAYVAGEKVKIKDDKGKEVGEKYFAFMVRNGVEQNRFVDVNYGVAQPFFSPDGRFLAYYAREELGGDEYFVINGEKIAKPNVAYHPAASPTFSPDSKSVGFAMKRQGEWFPVLDGQELKKAYEEIGPGRTRIGFTPDGAYTFIGLREGAYYWVEAGRR